MYLSFYLVIIHCKNLKSSQVQHNGVGVGMNYIPNTDWATSGPRNVVRKVSILVKSHARFYLFRQYVTATIKGHLKRVSATFN